MKKCPQCNHTFSENEFHCYSCNKSLVELPAQQSSNQYTPKCPTCGSPTIRRISTSNKVGSALTFGLFSMGHVGKTFKCENCKYEW